jgi:hypothetical protein
MRLDHTTFRTRLLEYRRAGAQALLDNGAQIDPDLLQELSITGSDQRYGVNVVVRPPDGVVSCIQAVQEQLRICEPEQYYYPAEDLHLTLLELCSRRTLDEADTLAATVLQVLPKQVQAAPHARVAASLLGYDQHGCALNFLPCDDGLQRLRQHLVRQFSAQGVEVAPRYPAQSVHVTVMRYLRPLQTEVSTWVEELQAIPSAHLEWQIDTLWLSWGATWYGMRSRTKQSGPYWVGQGDPEQI